MKLSNFDPGQSVYDLILRKIIETDSFMEQDQWFTALKTDNFMVEITEKK